MEFLGSPICSGETYISISSQTLQGTAVSVVLNKLANLRHNVECTTSTCRLPVTMLTEGPGDVIFTRHSWCFTGYIHEKLVLLAAMLSFGKRSQGHMITVKDL